MSRDIVERLRDCGVFMTTDENGDVQVGMRLVAPEDCHEAADEIERLRAERDAYRDLANELSDAFFNSHWQAQIERLRTAGDALDACVNQFGDTDNWTHDDGFLFHDEALAARVAWQEARREHAPLD